MQERKQARAGHGEERHRLGESVDRRPPVLLEQEEDRRDQGAGVADADPPDEVDDREAPHHRDVDPPDADAVVKQHGDRHEQEQRERRADAHAQKPAPVVGPHQHERTDLVGHRGIGVLRPQDRRGRPRIGRFRIGGSHRASLPRSRGWDCAAWPDTSCAAGCSARPAARNCASSPWPWRPHSWGRSSCRTRSPGSGQAA